MLFIVILSFIFIFLLMFAFAILLKGTKFRFEFFFLSIMFISAFYLFPIIISINDGYFSYTGNNYFVSEKDIYRHIIALTVFVAGFLMFDSLSYKSTKSNFALEPSPASNLFICLSACLIYLIFLGAYSLDYANAISLARKGQLELNPLITILFTFTHSLGVFCIFESKKRNSFLIFIIFAIPLLFLTLSVAGRTNVLSTVVLLLIFFRLPVKTAILISFALTPIVLPLLLNGKTIIYLLSNEATFSRILEAAYSPVNTTVAVSNNFGHVFLSFQLSENLVDLVGFRFFYDYVQGFLFYLRIFGMPIGDSLTYYNTELIYNTRASMIPIGYLSFGYVQMGFLGVFVSGAFYRFTGHIAEVTYLKLNFSGNMARFYLAFLAANSFYVGEVRTMVLTFFIPIFLLYVFGKIAFGKEFRGPANIKAKKSPPCQASAP